MDDKHDIIKNLISEIESIEKDSQEKIKNIHNQIKEEAKTLTYNEAYYLLHEVAFSKDEFCLIMNEIKEFVIE